jgi:tRNA pseudouridine38-40 synthase
VLSAQLAPDDFHARHSARAKTYEYRIFCGEICPPWLARYAYALNQPLDLEAMQRAAMGVLGEHDFTSFAASDPEKARRAVEPIASQERDNNLRTIHLSEWIAAVRTAASDHKPLLIYRVRGNGFLHHMVRNLVGTFLQVGRGNMTDAEIPVILSAQARALAGPTAPARGLFLVSVDY